MTDASASAVKVVFEWRVLSGNTAPFTRWLEQLVAEASASPGYQGSSVFTAREDWLVLLRFAARADLDRWQNAVRTVEHLAAGEQLAHGGQRAQHRTGLETWFTLPGAAHEAPPPRWKMALVTWCALLPQVVLLGAIMPTATPSWVATLVGTLVPVAMLTWFVMPALTRWLARWLYPRPHA
jgi:antibiotic biosynthesis monooxygenase (ABM) superfamily enzyme